MTDSEYLNSHQYYVGFEDTPPSNMFRLVSSCDYLVVGHVVESLIYGSYFTSLLTGSTHLISTDLIKLGYGMTKVQVSNRCLFFHPNITLNLKSLSIVEANDCVTIYPKNTSIMPNKLIPPEAKLRVFFPRQSNYLDKIWPRSKSIVGEIMSARNTIQPR